MKQHTEGERGGWKSGQRETPWIIEETTFFYVYGIDQAAGVRRVLSNHRLKFRWTNWRNSESRRNPNPGPPRLSLWPAGQKVLSGGIYDRHQRKPAVAQVFIQLAVVSRDSSAQWAQYVVCGCFRGRFRQLAGQFLRFAEIVATQIGIMPCVWNEWRHLGRFWHFLAAFGAVLALFGVNRT